MQQLDQVNDLPQQVVTPMQPLNEVKDLPQQVMSPSGEEDDSDANDLLKQIHQMRARISTLEQENRELSSRCRIQKEELESITRTNERSEELNGLIDRLSAHEKKLSSCTDKVGETATGFEASTEKISNQLTEHASAMKQTCQKLATSAQESSSEMTKVSEQSKQVQGTLTSYASDVKSCSEKFQAEATSATTILATLNHETVSKANDTIGNATDACSDAIVDIKKLKMKLDNFSAKITDTDSDVSVCQDFVKSLSSSIDTCSRRLDKVSSVPSSGTKCQPHKTAQQGGVPGGSFQRPSPISDISHIGSMDSTGVIEVEDSSQATTLMPSSSFLPQESQQISHAATRQSKSRAPRRSTRDDSIVESSGGSRRGKRKDVVPDDEDDLEQPVAKKPRAEKVSNERDTDSLLPDVIVNDDISYPDLNAELQVKLKETLSKLEKNKGTNWPWFTPLPQSGKTDNKDCVYIKCQKVKIVQVWDQQKACPSCISARRACVLMTSHTEVDDRHLNNMRLLPLPSADRSNGSTPSSLGYYVKEN
ncbi:uncharacterized protein MYCGRDRAFT_92879 [Zymoseptoria tritici IPO323]|uniref:Uncharacterized protein n=1 Tax=Zymoseptoria tritici (strain CBS 115943 / IPO323) TaxID=336722 RepID=F9X980_ZYMTI|nr:uncharacterized protein MYCGRDRAFT_92879 [Zymoseptoria tritici IPO323]EGP88140.1 hypothetical protein MYCGRDRAFT_92879 [Zymoseptoria tritici IPO323]